jgi:hypothetical protein
MEAKFLFCCDEREWRPTRTGALELLRYKLYDKRQNLLAEVEHIENKITDVMNKLYP